MQSTSNHVQGGASYQYTTGPLFQGIYDGDDSDFRLLAECLMEVQAFDDGRAGAKGVAKGMTKSSAAKAPGSKKNNMAKSVSIDRGKSTRNSTVVFCSEAAPVELAQNLLPSPHTLLSLIQAPNLSTAMTMRMTLEMILRVILMTTGKRG